MLSVIIATEGIESPVVATLAPLVPGAAAGLVREVLLVDRAANDVIERVADVAGCRFLHVAGGRPAALAAGVREARSPWLMLLRAGAVLEPGWIDEAAHFIQRAAAADPPRAALFRYARSPYTEHGWQDGLKWVARTLGGPSAEQGLLIARAHYDEVGGYGTDGRVSEKELLRRIGRPRRTLLRTRIIIT